MIGVSGYILTVVASLAVLAMAALLGLIVWRRLVMTQRQANRAEIRAAAAEACLAAAPVGCFAFAHLDGAARCSAELSRMLESGAGDNCDFKLLLERLGQRRRRGAGPGRQGPAGGRHPLSHDGEASPGSKTASSR